MNKNLKNTLVNCFLYTLLGIFVFALINLIGMYLFNSTNFLSWDWKIKVIILLASNIIPLLVSD